MVDRLLLTLCVVYLLVAAQAVPRGRKFEADDSKEDDSKEDDDNDCFLPVAVGSCRAYKDRYYFDKDAEECRVFKYGGCKGNDNNFKTLDDCMEKCGKYVKKETLEVKGRSEVEPKELPVPSEICNQPPTVGTRSCKAFMPRWTYDPTLGKCKEYIYGGCGGSANLFRTKKECKEVCEREEPESRALAEPTGSKPAVCDLPIEQGPCFGGFQRYGFNKELNRCEKFAFGGCGGNANNFAEEAECQKTCVGDAEEQKADACANVKCDLRLYQHYAQKACKPMYSEGACCPSYYECPDPSVFDNKCFYDGKFYEIGERMPEVTQQNPCRQGCFCQETIGTDHNTTITCANLECPESLGWLAPEKKMCVPVHKSADDCCASNFVNCRSATVSATGKVAEAAEAASETREPICSWDGKEYVEGQRFYPRQPGAPCQVCTCTREFNGIFGPGCRTAVCSIRLPNPECVPIYDEAVCCPYRYKCPSEYRETGIQVKSQEGVYIKDGPFITVGAPGKVPVSTLPIAARPPARPMGSPIAGTFERDGPFITVGAPGKVPVSTLPIAVPQPGNGTYKRDGPFIEVGAPGKVPVRTLPILVQPPAPEVATYNREGPFIEVAAPGKVPIRTLPALVPQGEFKRDGPLIQTGVPGKVPVMTLPIAITPIEGRSSEDVDTCSLDIVTGPCKMSKPSFGFDKQTGSCVPFLYGGCKGNSNRFSTKEECERRCRDRMARSDDREACTQEPYTGPCRAHRTRFFYNQTAQECQTFSFGGCRSNLNNFKTKEECETKCVEKAEVPVTEEPQLAARSEPVSPMPSIDVAPYCLFGGVRFELGEQLDTNEECVECTCSTPPELTCIKRNAPCAAVAATPPPRHQLVGGHSERKPITDEVAEMATSLRSKIEEEAKKQFEIFEPVDYKEQVVAGMNYIVRIKTGEESMITVKIHRSFRGDVSLIKIENYISG